MDQGLLHVQQRGIGASTYVHYFSWSKSITQLMKASQASIEASSPSLPRQTTGNYPQGVDPNNETLLNLPGSRHISLEGASATWEEVTLGYATSI